MKPLLLIVLAGLITGNIFAGLEILNALETGIFIVPVLLFIITLRSYSKKFKTPLTYAIIFLAFSGFGNMKTFLQKRYHEEISIESLKDVICTGEILQSKTNEQHYTMYQVDLIGKLAPSKEDMIHGKVVLICGSETRIPSGNRIAFRTKLNDFIPDPNPGSFDAPGYYKHHGFLGYGFIPESRLINLGPSGGIRAYFTRWQQYLAQKIDRYFPEKQSAIAKALILGDKSSLDNEATSSFSNTGAMHILAVSGLHVGILLYILRFLLARTYRVLSKQKTIFLAILLIWIFALLTGGSSSVLRSTVMFSILSIGELLFRRQQAINGLLLSAILLLSYNMDYLYDVGFQLSYTALAGIFLFLPSIQAIFTPNNTILQWLWKGSAAGLAATFATAPLMLYHFHQFPNYFLLSNVVVMLFGFPLLLTLVIFLLLNGIPVLKWVPIFAGLWLISFLLSGIHWINTIPGAVSTGFQVSGFQLIIIYLLLSLLIGNIQVRYIKSLTWIGILAWGFVLSIHRTHLIQEQKVVILSANNLACIFKNGEKLYFLYDERISPKKRDRMLTNYEKFSGSQCFQRISLKHHNYLQMANVRLQATQQNYGWELSINNAHFKFFSEEYPDTKDKNYILSKRIYQKMHHRPQTRIFEALL